MLNLNDPTYIMWMTMWLHEDTKAHISWYMLAISQIGLNIFRWPHGILNLQDENKSH
jgi:hypothetical protein